MLIKRTNRDFSGSSALCFTETWLGESIPDGILHLPGFQLYAHYLTELMEEIRREKICFHINEGWCMISQCQWKYALLTSRPFSLTANHYIHSRSFPPLFWFVFSCYASQACITKVLQHLTDQIISMESKHPDSLLIILGDFSRANPIHELPKYTVDSILSVPPGIKTHWTTASQYVRTYCSGTLLSLSGHVFLTYRQRLKSAKPVIKCLWEDGPISKNWSYMPILTALIGVFLGCIYRPGRAYSHCDISLCEDVCAH